MNKIQFKSKKDTSKFLAEKGIYRIWDCGKQKWIIN